MITTFRPATLTLLFLACISSQTQAERLPLKAYTVADGLAHNNINKIVRDSRGFLWFCTGDGLSRFDGYTFTNYGTDHGLPHGNISDLLETRAGEYWLATNGGVVRFNPKGSPLNRVVFAGETSAIDSMFTVIVPEDQERRARVITVLLEDRNGTIWCGTEDGLFRLERSNDRMTLRSVDIGIPHDYAEQRVISDLLLDRYDSLWAATPSGLYRRWRNGGAARYTKRDGLPNEFLQDLLEDHDQNLWVGTRMGGFFRLVTDDTHAPPTIGAAYSTRNGLLADWVFQLFETAGRRFWVATSRGLVEFLPNGDEKGRRFYSYTERNGLSFHDVTALNEDLVGNLWLGTNNAGAMKLARNGFGTFDEQEALSQVNAIFADRTGTVCFKGAKLLVNPDSFESHIRFGCFDGERFTWFKPKSIPYLGWTMEAAAQTRNGEWWVGSGDGLYRFPPSDSITQINNARPLAVYTPGDGLNPQVYRVFADSRDDVWFSTSGATTNTLARWNGASETLQDFGDSMGLPSLKDNLPRSFGEDGAGNIWVGFNTGIARYAHGSFKFFTAIDGVPSGAIMNMYLDRARRLWFTSARGGLVRIDDPGSERPSFVNYTTAQGLSSNNTIVITEDNHGHIYAGGGHGIDRLDPATGRVKHFTTADGLPEGTFLAAFRDATGALWFGMSRGLARITPAPDDPGRPPPIMITGLRVAGSSRLVSALGESEMSLADFPPNDNQLQLDFVGLNFVPGEVLRYQYKLEEANADWSPPSEERQVNYANLAPGRYRFLVRALTSDGTASPAPASITFTILRPLWQRWWFLTLAALACGGLIFAVFRYRVARVLEMANMRTRIATDLHDDIGANLTRISMLSEVAKQRLDIARAPDNGGAGERTENGQEDNPLLSISRIARESVGSMSDIVWAIDPERDSLLDLTRKMRQHADEVFTLRDIELRFNAPSVKESLRLGVDVRRDLLLIFKEAVNNAARHSRCTQVTIDLQLHASRLLLEIVDNGVGFDQSVESEGHGLRSMQRRAAALGGTLEISSNPGAETIIRVSTPIARPRRVS
ncbi:MAG: sensor histidine kinase [Pyrinomonadaceae bacterium]